MNQTLSLIIFHHSLNKLKNTKLSAIHKIQAQTKDKKSSKLLNMKKCFKL